MTVQARARVDAIASNSAGGAHTLAVLTQITPGHVRPLRDQLARLNSGPQSPLALLPATHFARWVVIDERVAAFRDAPHLLFDSCFDGDPEAYIEAMRTVMSTDADAIWMHCAGYPGAADSAAFSTYFRRNQITAGVFLAAYPQASVEQVRESLALRQQIIDFAITSQECDAPALLAAYRETFGRRISDAGSATNR